MRFVFARCSARVIRDDVFGVPRRCPKELFATFADGNESGPSRGPIWQKCANFLPVRVAPTSQASAASSAFAKLSRSSADLVSVVQSNSTFSIPA